MEKRFSLIGKDQDSIDEVIKGYQSYYYGNDTILGCINNLFYFMTNDNLDDDLYLIYNECVPYIYGFIRSEITKHMVVRKNNIKNLDDDSYIGIIYDYIINMMPNYREYSPRIINKVLKYKYPGLQVPRFIIERGNLFPVVQTLLPFEKEEGRKIYLDAGVVNYYSSMNKVIDFYIRFKNALDSDLKGKNTRVSHFKTRISYGRDGIVFRITKDGQYELFREMLSKDKELLYLLQNTNPFVPSEQIDGYTYGVIPNDDGSYNYFVSSIIFGYIKYCSLKNIEPDLNSFMDFVEQNHKTIYCPNNPKRNFITYGNILMEQIDKEMTR